MFHAQPWTLAAANILLQPRWALLLWPDPWSSTASVEFLKKVSISGGRDYYRVQVLLGLPVGGPAKPGHRRHQ